MISFALINEIQFPLNEKDFGVTRVNGKVTSAGREGREGAACARAASQREAGAGDAGPPPWAPSSSPQSGMQPIASFSVIPRYVSVSHQMCFAVRDSLNCCTLPVWQRIDPGMDNTLFLLLLLNRCGEIGRADVWWHEGSSVLGIGITLLV